MAYDALDAQTPRAVYIGAGTRGPFAFADADGNPIRIRDQTQLVVRRYSATTDETGTLLTLNTDYTVNNADVDAVTLTLTALQDVLASTERLVVSRLQTIDDVLTLTGGGDFSLPVLGAAISVLVEELQEARRDIDRKVEGDWRQTTPLKLPLPPASGVSPLGRNSTGAIVNAETADFGSGTLVDASWIAALSAALGNGWQANFLRGASNPYVLASIATLQAATFAAADAPPIILLRTNYAAGDGGGVFAYDSTDTTSTDEGGCTILTNTSGTKLRYKRLVRDTIDLRWYSGSLATSATAAFNAAMAWAKLNGVRTIQLPVGPLIFLTQPTFIDFPLEVRGYGLATTCYRGYAGTTKIGLFHHTDLGGGTASGMTIRDMAIYALTGSSGGAAISGASLVGFAVGSVNIENVRITSQANDLWTNVLYFEGILRTSAPTGFREVSLKNVTVFGANGYSVVLDGVVGFDWHGGGCYPAGGTNSASGGMYIKGSAGVPNSGIDISFEAVDDIQIDYCQNGTIKAEGITGALVAGANPTQTWVWGTATGGATLTWSASCRYVAKTGLSMFRAHKNGVDQTSLTSATAIKLTFTTAAINLNSNYDATNSKWIPYPGPVRINAKARLTTNVLSGNTNYVAIYKNGVAVDFGEVIASSNGVVQCAAEINDVANGTDYYEAYAFGGGAGDKTCAGTITYTSFEGNQLL